jgi:ATPase subunit of ABC transporter with duplicated ATPase domains
VCRSIVYLHGQHLTQYRGDYDSFVKARQQAEATEAKRKKKAAETVVREAKPPAISFPDPGELGAGTCLIQFKEVGFGYEPGKWLFRGLDFGIYLSSRSGLVGRNGVGKTTLLRLISGELPQAAQATHQTEGEINRRGGMRIAHFHQHHVDRLTMGVSAVKYMQSRFPTAQEQEMRKFLGRFGLHGDAATRPIQSLSGGEKSRLAPAELSWARPHVLLLNEPTNHFDAETTETLIAATRDFAGGIVLVTHHQRLIEAACEAFGPASSPATCDEIWAVRPGGAVERGFAEYRKNILGELVS